MLLSKHNGFYRKEYLKIFFFQDIKIESNKWMQGNLGEKSGCPFKPFFLIPPHKQKILTSGEQKKVCGCPIFKTNQWISCSNFH